MAAIDDGWLSSAYERKQRGCPFILVTIVAVAGSSPREVGARMVVDEHTTSGTIGGGNLEWQAIATAKRMLADHSETAVQRHDVALGPTLGQCCGGRVSVLFERIGTLPTLVVFGAGHVGTALVTLLHDMGIRIIWVDAREAMLPTQPPVATVTLVQETPEMVVDDLPADAVVVVMTHSHQDDLAVVEKLLMRNDMRFVGVIGSASKAAKFRHRLLDKGVDKTAVATLVCPIGDKGCGKQPKAVAIAVAATVLPALFAEKGRTENE